MATNLKLYSGSKLIGSPVVFEVTAHNLDAGATFHQVRIVLTANASVFEFSQPASNGEKLYFDISSAFRALAEKYEYTAEGVNPIPNGGYPSYGNAAGDNIKACDDYLLGGVEHRGEQEVTGTLAGPYYQGYLTDRERLLYGTNAQELPSQWSRKPKSASPEICFIGNPHLHAGAFGNNPSVSSTQVIKGMQTIGGHQVYGINQPADGFELRFINSLGVHENVFVTCLRQSEVNIKNDFYTIARLETLKKFSRGVSVKQNDYETWKMSSGPVDRAWQQWWLHEPLMAKWAWLNVDSQWLPVHIVPEETTVGIDRAKGNLLEVQFTLRFDINGSPFKS